MPEQQVLVEIEAQPQRTEPEAGRAPRLKSMERGQSFWAEQCLEDLIGPDHIARAIWELTGKLPLDQFLAGNKSVEGVAGRERNDPRVLVSLWVYSYTREIGSARELERQMSYEPGMRWLSGGETINHHTLSDFRVHHGKALQEVFAALLGVLDSEGLVNLEEMTLDGTKMEAVAGCSSLRTGKTLRQRMEVARQVVEELSREPDSSDRPSKQEAARRRAARERLARLEQALEQVELQQKHSDKDPQQVRASFSEPEVRILKDGHGGYDAAYNVQSVVETQNRVIINVGLTQQASDSGQLEPALERLQQDHIRQPARMIVDGAYINHHNVEAMSGRQVELIGPVWDLEQQRERNRNQSLEQAGISAEFAATAFVVLEEGGLRCPVGRTLKLRHRQGDYEVYQAAAEDCGGCEFHSQCCPHSAARTVKKRVADPLAEHQQRMRSERAKEIYRKRGPVAEFPHAWIKDKLGLRKFHVRGLYKAGLEALWAAFTYNVQQWVRLVWRRPIPAAAA